jgi:uncharacterized protein (TIGR00269 family)
MEGEDGYLPGCDACPQPAVYYDRNKGRHLCGAHLVSDIEARARSTIDRYDMIRTGDRIAVGLSGGKDSSALLILLSKIVPDYCGASLIAVTVDEGIAGYRDETIASAIALTGRLGITHRIVSFESMYGRSLDLILEQGTYHPCTVCGILRKKALAEMARKEQADSIATGHNLDDEAQSVLMNYLRGDLGRLVRRSGERKDCGFTRRIKPFLEVAEKEVTLYGILNDCSVSLPECPYAGTALRSEVRSMQSSLEYAYPGSSLRLIHGREHLFRLPLHDVVGKERSCCTICGDPCSGTICQACRLLLEISGEKNDDRKRFTA